MKLAYQLTTKALRNKRGVFMVDSLMGQLILLAALPALLMMVYFGSMTIIGLDKKIKEAQALDFPKLCDFNEACTGEAIICMHDNANGKTIQACNGQCSQVNGLWMKGSTVCNWGVQIK